MLEDITYVTDYFSIEFITFDIEQIVWWINSEWVHFEMLSDDNLIDELIGQIDYDRRGGLSILYK